MPLPTSGILIFDCIFCKELNRVHSFCLLCLSVVAVPLLFPAFHLTYLLHQVGGLRGNIAWHVRRHHREHDHVHLSSMYPMLQPVSVASCPITPNRLCEGSVCPLLNSSARLRLRVGSSSSACILFIAAADAIIIPKDVVEMQFSTCRHAADSSSGVIRSAAAMPRGGSSAVPPAAPARFRTPRCG